VRYPREQKLESRQKLVRASGSHAKGKGFAGSGVDALAAAAGVTSGAFYKHFGGKEQLLAAIVETELATTTERFAAIDGEHVLQAIDAYLSLGHVRHPEAGCVLPTLAPEIARASSETRETFERALGELNRVLTEKLGDAARASALVSLAAGAVMIARGLATDAAKREVLHAARAAARALI
jgi:AcrR family transcriptional regulator